MATSVGSIALTKALTDNRELRRTLAFECKVSEQTTRNWESGTTPKACYRPMLQRLIGIDWTDWEKAPPARRRRAEAA